MLNNKATLDKNVSLWTRELGKSEIAYPSEYVIRIFKGKYPKLDLTSDLNKGKKICDVGCGDGRNLALLKTCGYDISGVEINQQIVDRVKENLKPLGVDGSTIKVGSNDKIDFPDASFDYLLSWNACYYMGEVDDFQDHVKEFARVTKPSAKLVLSIPTSECFIYKGSDELKSGYRIIREDPFGVRNGGVLRMFSGEDEIVEAFSEYFEDFVFGSINDDCFGYDYKWHLIIASRKG